ncbi:hypothetical protein MRX96_045592 [Rhipicephalus microplus]
MKLSAVCLMAIAELSCTHGMFLGNMLLPVGNIVSSSGILGFKISTAASLIPLVTEGITSGDYFRVGTVASESSAGKPEWLASEQEEQQVMSQLLLLLDRMNAERCMSRLACESAANAQRLGRVGNATAHLFNSTEALKTGAKWGFDAAADTGRSRGISGCDQEYADCPADLHRVLSSAELI